MHPDNVMGRSDGRPKLLFEMRRNARFTLTPAEEEAFGQFARRRDAYELLTQSHRLHPVVRDPTTLYSRHQKGVGVHVDGGGFQVVAGRDETSGGHYLMRCCWEILSLHRDIAVFEICRQDFSRGNRIYTSGKGSLVVGLTASVVKNATGEFYLEGGASDGLGGRWGSLCASTNSIR